MIFFKDDKAQNGYRNLLTIVGCLLDRSVDVFDRVNAENAIYDLAIGQYRLRVYNEALYLNSIYLDYFNSSNTVLTVGGWYGMNEDEFESLLVVARCCHLILQREITTIKEIENNG
ncbi:MAG: hypothetical protein GY829_05860 [Gammaproteobacteria bacterium]|nr:hypothetical protein [Gammaproteobacteria bacterium]